MSRFEEKESAAPAPLPLERAGRGAAEEQSAAEQSFFRGKPIAWVTVPTAKTVVTENAFGDSEASERPGRKNHFILYDGNQYKREEFYQMAFP
ncbi:MAG: hypothetical protein HDT14_10610 [Oscillibacter sp.]|nr:hypothetical protein [Oscillibacter sp.]